MWREAEFIGRTSKSGDNVMVSSRRVDRFATGTAVWGLRDATDGLEYGFEVCSKRVRRS